MNPDSQYQQALLRQQDLIREAQHERQFQQLRREAQHADATSTETKPIDSLIIAVGSRLEAVGRAMQGSRRQSA